MNRLQYKLNRLSILFDIGIHEYKEFEFYMDYNSKYQNTPLKKSVALRLSLMDRTKEQEVPVIYQDEYQVFWGCIRKEKAYYYLGPLAVESFSFIELHRYYRGYHLKEEIERPIKRYSFVELLQIIEVIAEDILKKQYLDDDLVEGNRLVSVKGKQLQNEKEIFHMVQEKEETYHHSYQAEQFLLECVRQGRVEESLVCSRNMDCELGKMAKNEKNHWNNAAVAAITLCTRAAIEGGVAPKAAYQLSDFYIQKIDQTQDVFHKIEFRNKAIQEMTNKVQEKQNQKQKSLYVEQCKDYISKNYRNKIYTEDIAAGIGLSPSYLSRFFFRKTGIHLQDYINKFRVEHATNLLRYSEEPLLYISEYLSFQSQSYFGKIFKKYKNMTPKEYREHYKTREFKSI